MYADDIERRLQRANVTKQVATVINSPTSEHHGRIIAARYELDGADNHEYTWLPFTTATHDPVAHFNPLPYREGGSLLYDETVTYYNSLPNWLPQSQIVIDNETPTTPTFFYGLKVTDFTTGAVSTTDAATDPLGIDGYRERRREIILKLTHNWWGTRFNDLIEARRATATDTDNRYNAWVQLLENWVYGATCVCNDLTGTDNSILRGVTNWTFEDFYENIQTGDLINERLGTSRATGIQGSNFFYLERENNSSSIRLRYTPAIRKAPQYSKLWATNVLGRGFIYTQARGIHHGQTNTNY